MVATTTTVNTTDTKDTADALDTTDALDTVTYPAISLTSIRVSNEHVPNLKGSLGRYIESSILEEEGHELDVDIHTLWERKRCVEEGIREGGGRKEGRESEEVKGGIGTREIGREGRESKKREHNNLIST